MSRQRRADTRPELALRSELHRRGLRFRVNRQVIPSLRRTADISFGPSRVAVMIDGCFWHGCPDHATEPRSNAQWWRQKLDRNIQRDRETDRRLAEAGWLVLRFWEHENPVCAADIVQSAVMARRPSRGRKVRVDGDQTEIPDVGR